MLEKFIKDNSSAFDASLPSDKVWANIDKALGSSDRLEQFLSENKAFMDTNIPEERVGQRMFRILDNADNLEKYLLEQRSELDLHIPAETIWHGIDQGLGTPQGLESFLAQNRNALDTAEPQQHIWEKIEQNLPKTQNQDLKIGYSNWSRNLMKAAASVALLLTCFGAGIWYAKNGQAEGAMVMGEVSGEYAELEQYYQRDIAGKKMKLASYTEHSENVNEDLVQMDKALQDLKIELANVPPSQREQVIRAMIETYKAKANILEKVLEQVQKNQPSTQQKSDLKNEIKNI